MCTSRPSRASGSSREGIAGQGRILGLHRLDGGTEPPSAFFDGARWAAEPEALLKPLPGQARGVQLDKPMRYFVELRLIDAETRRIVAALY